MSHLYQRLVQRLRHVPGGRGGPAVTSLRWQLMAGILLPVVLVLAVNTVFLYRQALAAVNIAYDRTLLASAKAIGEQLEVTGVGDEARLNASLLYSSLEAFEADNRSRLFYRVSGFAGEMVSGFADLPVWTGHMPVHSTYAALVDFYDDSYQGQPVRMAVLLQPVAGPHGQGMATVQVAETLELRETLARQILVDTLWRQLALLGVIAGVVVWVVHRATRPVQQLGAVLAMAGVLPAARFVVFHCADRFGEAPYYESIDLVDAFHPQTIVAWAMNGRALPVEHGAPVRMRVERQLGYKQAKYVMRIEVRASLAGLYGGKGGYWEDSAGYQWYAGI